MKIMFFHSSPPPPPPLSMNHTVNKCVAGTHDLPFKFMLMLSYLQTHSSKVRTQNGI